MGLKETREIKKMREMVKQNDLLEGRRSF